MEDSLLAIESEAASNVAVDTGALKNSIQSTPIKVTKNEITGGVEVGANYAAYVEFGTGTKVKVPAELNDFAAQGLRLVEGDEIRQVMERFYADV